MRNGQEHIYFQANHWPCTSLQHMLLIRWSYCKRAGLKLPRIMWAGNISYQRKACCNNISTRWHPLSAKQLILDMIKNFDETFPKFTKASVTQTRLGESLFSQTHLQFLSTILQCRWPREKADLWSCIETIQDMSEVLTYDGFTYDIKLNLIYPSLAGYPCHKNFLSWNLVLGNRVKIQTCL